MSLHPQQECWVLVALDYSYVLILSPWLTPQQCHPPYNPTPTLNSSLDREDSFIQTVSWVTQGDNGYRTRIFYLLSYPGCSVVRALASEPRVLGLILVKGIHLHCGFSPHPLLWHVREVDNQCVYHINVSLSPSLCPPPPSLPLCVKISGNISSGVE